MEIFLAIVALLAGLGTFLLGFKLLGDNMEKIASGGLKRMFSKTAKSRLAGVGIGAAATAIVQSSSVTTVMVVGFVNVGVMSLYQATAIIMGCNIGTTITGHIVSLQTIPFIEVATLLTLIGIFMDMFSKSDKVKSVGLMLAGLGLVFVGLELMGDSMSQFATDDNLKSILSMATNPFLMLLIGLAVTAVVQSSSAVTSVIITMAGQGLIFGGGGNSVLYLILGTNIGTCVTALLSSIGANRNARRACIIHLMFNTFGAIIFFIVLLCWPSFMEITFAAWFPGDPGRQIAMFHTFFNVICTILFLPFTNGFVKLSGILVPERKKKGKAGAAGLNELPDSLMDERLLGTPSVAIEQLGKAQLHLADMSMDNLRAAFDAYLRRDDGAAGDILRKNEEIMAQSKQITDYLVRVSGEDISMQDEQIVSAMHHNLGDIVRIAELADNLTKYTHREIKYDLTFSSGVNDQLEKMFEKIEELYAAVHNTLEEGNPAHLSDVDALEDEVDAMRKKLIEDHIERLNGGYCKPENSNVFINLVSNLERAGDHLSYLAHSIEEVYGGK